MWKWIEDLIAMVAPPERKPPFQGQVPPWPAPEPKPEVRPAPPISQPPTPALVVPMPAVKTPSINTLVLGLQQRLHRLGAPIAADGIWGPQTDAAADIAIKLGHFGLRALPWGNSVSAEFRALVMYVGEQLLTSPNNLMAVMAFETGETFSADVRNPRSSATGLIQFMEGTAKGLGTTTAELALMTAEQQLVYVEQYLRPYRGRLESLEDCYMAVLYPRAIGMQPEDQLPWNYDAYRANSGLDADRDGSVTKAEASAKVVDALHRGLVPPNVWISQ